MSHIKPLTRSPQLCQLDPLESFIILFFGTFFRGFDNIRGVVTNLQKFFAKTP